MSYRRRSPAIDLNRGPTTEVYPFRPNPSYHSRRCRKSSQDHQLNHRRENGWIVNRHCGYLNQPHLNRLHSKMCSPLQCTHRWSNRAKCNRSRQLGHWLLSSKMARLPKSEIKKPIQTDKQPTRIHLGFLEATAPRDENSSCRKAQVAVAPKTNGNSTRNSKSFPSNSKFIGLPSLANGHGLVIVVEPEGEQSQSDPQ